MEFKINFLLILINSFIIISISWFLLISTSSLWDSVSLALCLQSLCISMRPFNSMSNLANFIRTLLIVYIDNN